ncbi:aminotransferase class I/II-fold pyridoxal phosphate-dependent enzyme [Novosphingobium sp. KCTC 2891]|uniref:pyridoxal phosphate-dependent aminotransferase n=1 Tax=Novosphingobium sp. KCTC 2891 TaxID=2989730 RepID=UPI0022217098|nr:aminotransferase class I/II-fold pyridoxal phosphate-dependent enzyme [Novosphingobium sp. KCTC 2891]MCW1383128.1 aminotransferase class I/II-fold pyridoxal phosphate-dependent enzyme [Novosphingobium sp. KCTC 2891]
MIARLEPFHAISVSVLAHRLKAEGRDVIHMEFGQPSTGAPAAAIAEAHRVLDSDPMGYWQSDALKARIALHYRESCGVAVDPSQVILTCGASPALVMALSLLFGPGARVAIARPGYVAYRNNLRALFMEAVELPCGPEQRFQLTAAALEALDPAPDGVILASPANPTGTVIPADELAAIVDVCRRRGIRIVSDEIYHGITYGEPAVSVLGFDSQALIVNSFSKYFSMAGWRLGWLVVPPDLVGQAVARMGNLFLTPPSLSQHAGLVAWDCRDELEDHVATYARNRDLLLDALPGMGLARIAPPDGAFYIWADIGHLTDDSLAFCERLLRDTGVCTAPGIDFDPVEGHHFIRFSFAVSTPLVEEAIRRMKPWFAAQKKD